MAAPMPARTRGGALRKDARAVAGSPSSTPLWSRGGAAAALMLLRGGYSSATPIKAPALARAASNSPRALLAAMAKGTPSPLRRALARRRQTPAPPVAPALPKLKVKKFAPMESYKNRVPAVDTRMAPPLPKPYRRSRGRESAGASMKMAFSDAAGAREEMSQNDDMDEMCSVNSRLLGSSAFQYSAKGESIPQWEKGEVR